MKKWKKVLASVLCASTLIGTPIAFCAATPGYQPGFNFLLYSDSRYELRYCYGTGGNHLEFKVHYLEIHPTTGDEYSNYQSNYVVGGYTSVECFRTADLGYEYYSIDLYGYVNSKLNASLLDVRPID